MTPNNNKMDGVDTLIKELDQAIDSLRNPKNTAEDDCPSDHTKLVSFDPATARDLDSSEIRRRWPRVTCQECHTILYASYDHYIAGDW